MSGIRNTVENKQPKIKGLVKRCRSFKEDIMSRLARNRSLAKDESSSSSSGGRGNRNRSGGGWNSGGTSPVPSDPEITDPSVLIAHRLKEAYLTLQFVESLIQKNCVDLLGGSSNVMLDLMGHLLNDVKGLTAISHTSAYQSTVAQLKSALGDFLTAIDVLLLRERCDDVQKELYFEKVLETLKSTRDALARLKSLVDTKENGNPHYTNSVRHHSTSCASVTGGGSGSVTTTTITPTQSPLRPPPPLSIHTSTPRNSNISCTSNSNSNRDGGSGGSGGSHSSILASPTSTTGGGGGSNTALFPGTLSPVRNTVVVGAGPSSSEEEKELLLLNGRRSSSKSPSERGGVGGGVGGERRPPLPPKLKQWTAKSFDSEVVWSPSPSSTSLPYPLAQLVGQSGTSGGGGSPHRHQSLLAQWLEQSSRDSSGSGGGHHVHPHHQRSLSQHGRPTRVTESSSSIISVQARFRSKARGPATRTFSDSYQLEDSSDSLDRLGRGVGDFEYDSRSGKSGNTHNSQSLSLGSSLDNLLLVDNQSQSQSGGSGCGISPGTGVGSGKGNRISASSTSGGGNSSTGFLGLGANYYDEEGEDSVFASSENVLGGSSGRLTENEENGPPPNLPEKRDRRHFILGQQEGTGTSATSPQKSGSGPPRCPSPYENVDETDLATWHGRTDVESQNSSSGNNCNFMSYSESRHTLVDNGERPPLPPKKKHSLIAAYIEFLQNFESYQAQHHHTHFHNHLNQIHHMHQQQQQQVSSSSSSFTAEEQRRQFRAERSITIHNPGSAVPQPQGSGSGGNNGGGGGSSFSTRSTSTYSYHQLTAFSEEGDEPSEELGEHVSCVSPVLSEYDNTTTIGSTATYATNGRRSNEEDLEDVEDVGPPPALPPKRNKNRVYNNNNNNCNSSRDSQGSSPCPPPSVPIEEQQGVVSVSTRQGGGIIPSTVITTSTTPIHTSMESPQLSIDEQSVDIYMTDAYSSLTPNEHHSHNSSSNSNAVNGGGGSSGGGSRMSSSSSSSEGPEIKGGEPHVLIVYAASPDLKDQKFRQVFLLTYRTFVRPVDVVNLLWKRYQHFQKKSHSSDRPSMLHARATLDLFADVVNSLTPMDLEDEMVAKVRDCIYHLVASGEIQGALKARKGLIHKYQIRLKLLGPKPPPVALAVSTETSSLLQYSATSIAQQMTLLDADLFRQLEPAELLLWAREQTEDFCPALNHFTEHFNKVSYWARSKVLLCCNSRERNRTMKKMIQVMRKLREYNNFNSLLAVLAALDSAPIRRLGFSRRLTEALKPHAALTDSSGSFRTYRQALAESKPPCIPYIGLVLQDLTFVHIGNADFLSDGKVNWVKRWQQWVVLEPVRRFHTCHYGFVRNDPLLTFLNNFDEFLNDDELWQLSESIKPRSKNN